MRQLLLPLLVSITAFSTVNVALAADKGAGHVGGLPTKSAAAENSNGIRSVDRDKGLARADDRRNAHSVSKSHGHKGHLLKKKMASAK